jgi:hypothetical protein
MSVVSSCIFFSKNVKVLGRTNRQFVKLDLTTGLTADVISRDMLHRVLHYHSTEFFMRSHKV